MEVIHHPVFGPLVRGQTFREFRHLREFWHPDRERVLSSPYLPDYCRAWVEDWKNHTLELAGVCRNSPVHAALQSLGVYEVHVSMPRNGEPSQSQEASYRYFGEHEEEICANVIDAVQRYYRFWRVHLSDWMDDDYPENPTLEELAQEVDFDGFLVCRCTSHGVSPLRLAWEPSWDPEHGLLMAVYGNQVIWIGTDDVDELLRDPNANTQVSWEGMWGREQMNEAEIDAYREFVDGHQSGQDVDYL